jgi:hypothetical protein
MVDKVPALMPDIWTAFWLDKMPSKTTDLHYEQGRRRVSVVITLRQRCGGIMEFISMEKDNGCSVINRNEFLRKLASSSHAKICAFDPVSHGFVIH